MTLVLDKKGKTKYKETYEHVHERHQSYHEINCGMRYMDLWLPAVSLKTPILDVGCGNGMLCWEMFDRGYGITGMDIIEIPYHRRGYKYVQHDITQVPWPFDDNAYHLAMAFDVLEHLDDDDLDSTVKEFCRVSKGQVASIPDAKGQGKLHRIIKPGDWWLKRLNSTVPGWRICDEHHRNKEKNGKQILITTSIFVRQGV